MDCADATKKRYQIIDQQERELNIVKELGTANSSFVIEPRGASKVRSEGTVVHGRFRLAHRGEGRR
jgi:hypothetical protein